MDERTLDFIRRHSTAIMVTVRKNGSAHVARVSVGVVDGKLWSSGTQARVRTKHLRSNPRATFCIFAQDSREWLGLEGRVTILEGPNVPQHSLRLRQAEGRPPEDEAEYLRTMVEEGRLIYELEVERVYGGY